MTKTLLVKALAEYGSSETIKLILSLYMDEGWTAQFYNTYHLSLDEGKKLIFDLVDLVRLSDEDKLKLTRKIMK